MDRPRLLLVPEFTELTWTIKPQLSEWAEVASYDPPGVGDEPLPPGRESQPAGDQVRKLSRELVVQRGLDEVDRRGWRELFVLADGWSVGAAARIAAERRPQVLGMALGHATVRQTRAGERPTTSPAVYDALTELLSKDHEEFMRYGIAQATGGSVSEELADQMIRRFPRDLIVAGWQAFTADDEFEELLRGLDLPLLLAKHEGCLMSTSEGYEDAVAALPGAKTLAVPEAPSNSERFAAAVREFCEEVSRQPARESAER